MKQVKILDQFYADCQRYNTISELLFNEDGRPCVLIAKLKYKGSLHKFVIPMRSNISPTTPKSQYFALPPNRNTRRHCSHGIHYIKLFPVVDNYIAPYYISSQFDCQVKSIIDKNEKEIINKCQEYLNQCENGNKHYMTPDIDGILSWLYK